MSPSSTRAFAARLANDDGFRALVAQDPRAALAQYGIADEPGLIPNVVDLPSKDRLAALELPKKPEPPAPQPPKPPQPMPIHVQLFDPD